VQLLGDSPVRRASPTDPPNTLTTPAKKDDFLAVDISTPRTDDGLLFQPTTENSTFLVEGRQALNADNITMVRPTIVYEGVE